MESRLERISPIECRVRVEIPWIEVSPRLEERLRELRVKARIPGFRPGKVPPRVIERMFGKNVRQELARDMVQETFQTAVVQHGTTPLTSPVLESSSLNRDEPFVYAARFEVPPNITPKDYVGVNVERRKPKADEAKVEAKLKQKLEELTELRPVAEGREDTAAGDVWTVDVEGTFGATRIAKKDARVEIGSEVGELVPGLSKALEGTKLVELGKTKTLRFVPPEHLVRPELHGQEAVLTLGLRDVREKHVPLLDDEFARDTGEAESLVELREKYLEIIRDEDREQAEIEARRKLVAQLLERNQFDTAPSLVAREVAAQVDAFKRQVTSQGLTLARLGTSESALAQRIRPEALFNVKAFLLLDAIGKAEGIVVSDDEVEVEVKLMAEGRGQNVTRLRATMEKNGQLVLLHAQLREQKILDFLMEKAQVIETENAPQADDAPSGSESESATT